MIVVSSMIVVVVDSAAATAATLLLLLALRRVRTVSASVSVVSKYINIYLLVIYPIFWENI